MVEIAGGGETVLVYVEVVVIPGALPVLAAAVWEFTPPFPIVKL